MANAASQSKRSNLILDPYPSIVDPEDSSKLALDPKVRTSVHTHAHTNTCTHTCGHWFSNAQEKDFELVTKVLGDVVKCREQLVVS